MPDSDAKLQPSPPPSAPPRAGLTAAYLRSKRAAILAELGSQAHPVRWLAACGGCGRAPRELRPWPWLAMLAWNQMNLATQDYRALPLFWLDDLDPEAARARMTGIRHDLELRRNLAGLDRRLARSDNRRPPGQTYQRRLDAYLQWAMLALRLIKLASTPADQPLPPRSAP